MRRHALEQKEQTRDDMHSLSVNKFDSATLDVKRSQLQNELTKTVIS